MDLRLPSLPRWATALLCGVALAACSGGAYRLEFEMQPANEASVRIAGKYPGLVVFNRGPGRLEVRLDAPVGVEAARTVYLLEPGESLSRRLARPTVVHLRTPAGERADAVIETRDADGLQVQSAPVPVGG